MTINPPVIDFVGGYQDNPRNGPIYPSFIPKTDADGNDIAGGPPARRHSAGSRPTPVGRCVRGSGQRRMRGLGPADPVPEDPGRADGDRRSAAVGRGALPDLRRVLHQGGRRHRRTWSSTAWCWCEDASSELARMVTLGVNRGVSANACPRPRLRPQSRSAARQCRRRAARTCGRPANAACQANASINNGSSDQDGDSGDAEPVAGRPLRPRTTAGHHDRDRSVGQLQFFVVRRSRWSTRPLPASPA